MSFVDQVAGKLFTARVLLRSGVVAPTRPDRLLKVAATMKAWGPTPAGGYTVSAIRYPDELAIIDERGTLTFAEVRSRTNRIARALQAAGIGQGAGVAIMCRNHRGFVDAVVACSKVGADALYLNTAFAGPQIADVVRREGATALIYDSEFAGLIAEAGAGLKRFVAWHDADWPASDPQLEDLIVQTRDELRPRRALQQRPRRHPHQWHDRHAQGRQPPPAPLAGPGRRAAGPHPRCRRVGAR